MVSMKGTYPFLTLTILVNFTWLFLSIANLKTDENGQPDEVFKKLGGAFGLLVAFTAWYNMYAGLANESNRSVSCSSVAKLLSDFFKLSLGTSASDHSETKAVMCRATAYIWDCTDGNRLTRQFGTV